MSGILCPKVEMTFTLLGKKWTGLILYKLLEGPMKFTDIERFIPNLSGRMLAERLKELEQAGVLERKVYNETPIRIEYVLSPKGEDLKDVIKEVGKWSEKWQ